MSKKIWKILERDTGQTIQSYLFACFKGKSQSAFSIIEVMISLGLLGISFTAYMKFSANASVGTSNMSEKIDLFMLRKFVHANFSCEKTLEASSERKGGRLTFVNCPGRIAGLSMDILNKDGKILFAKGGTDFGVYKDSQGKNQGGYKVVGICDGNGTVPDQGSPVQVPTFRFLATNADNPIPLNTFNILKLSPGWSDVLDGGELECAIPDDPGLPMDTKCTAMIVSRPGGIPTEEVSGHFFRSNGLDTMSQQNRRLASLVLRTYREQDLAISSTEGRPTSWRLKWINKNPDETIGDPITGRRVVDGFAVPVASPSFIVPANLTLMNPNQPIGNCAEGGVVTAATPAVNATPACSYWEQKVEFTQMSNPPDWYAAPLDLVIEGLDSSQNVMTSCSTKMQLVSPLVLTWPRNAGMPEDLDFHPTTTKFDIAASGKKVSSGWIGGFSAFLVLDRNKNGRIDNGSELFGDATAIEKSTDSKAARHPHGFAALAEFDDNQDLFIDQEDEVYTDLRLWFDDDADGESQPWELHTLAAFEVKKIALRFKSVDKQPKEANMLTKFAYESSFYGPEICGPSGCRIYDIFFTMAHPRDAE